MPYCPNCGNQVKETHFYCGQCGYSLTEEVNNDSDQTPAAGSAANRHGFLSGRSIQYLSDVINSEQDLDPDKVGYSNLARDVGAGLADFAHVSAVDDINLLLLVHDHSSNTGVLGRDPEHLNESQRQEWMMWMGLMKLPKLYDQSFGTEWSEDLSKRLSELIEEAKELKQEE